MPKNKRSAIKATEESPMYDEDSIGAAIDEAFDNVIKALNALRDIVKQL